MTALSFRIAPMLLSQRREPFDGEHWLFEPKWDGWRCMAVVHGRTRLLSRNGNDLSARFPTVAAAVAQLPDGTVLDRELVVLDGDDCPDFTALMRRRGAPCLLAFDMLALAGRDLCAEPVEGRKHRLLDAAAGLSTPIVQNTEFIVGEGRALFEAIRARAMEGIIAKRLGSAYSPGRRTGAWIKIKGAGLRARPRRVVQRQRAATAGAGVMAEIEKDPSMPERPPLAALRAIEQIEGFRSWTAVEMYRQSAMPSRSRTSTRRALADCIHRRQG